MARAPGLAALLLLLPLLIGGRLGLAAEDGAELLQVQRFDSENSWAGDFWEFNAEALALAHEAGGAPDAEAARKGKKVVGLGLGGPGYIRNAVEAYTDLVRQNYAGLELVLAAQRRNIELQDQMMAETWTACNAYWNGPAGGNGLVLAEATLEELQTAKPLLKNVITVYDQGWKRQNQESRRRAREIYEFYANGPGQNLTRLSPDLLRPYSPEHMQRIQDMYEKPMRKCKTAMNRNVNGDREGLRWSFNEVREAIQSMKVEVTQSQARIVEGESTGQTMRDLFRNRIFLTLPIGEEFLNKANESIRMTWSMAHNTERLMARVSRLVI